MLYDSWLLHWFIISNVVLLAIAVGNYLYRESKGYADDED